jgi:Eco57I restriction endonuclease.
LFYGFGGLPQAFPRPNGSIAEGWEDVVPALQEVTTSEEYAAIRRSTLDAHYTADMVVESMWAGVERMGIKAHREPFRIWESSIGSGVFFALMPKSLQEANPFLERSAVEMDTISATVSQVLFPEDRIINAPLQNVPLRHPVDLVIGNPPFGSLKLLDMNRRDLSLIAPNTHSYFFAKSINALNEGGIAALVVSRYLLDANRDENQAFRRWMHRHAELLHAVRLPRTAFSKTAFTEVVTDILVLRKRAEPLPMDTPDPDWINGKVFLRAKHQGKPITANGWYANREHLILGVPSLAGKMYGGPKEEEFTVLPLNDVPLTELLAERFVAQLPEDGFSQWVSKPSDRIDAGPKLPKIDQEQVGLVQPYGYFSMPEAAAAELAEDFGKTQSGIRIARRLPDDFEGEFQYALVDEANAKHFPRLAGMIALRDTAMELLTRQLSMDASDGELNRLRARLNQHYDQFRKAFGCLNSQANARLLRGDPGSAIVVGLERDYDKGVSSDMARKTGEKIPQAQCREIRLVHQADPVPGSSRRKSRFCQGCPVHHPGRNGRGSLVQNLSVVRQVLGSGGC